ncbi:MAG: betaine-aldehyde dehydrogenase [Paracoccaceae bacterium]|jgi:betaine-aldehyde dehydrogenase|nr:betaine-aldehyde dehydrogenase [Paracoccaceae bacterium]MBT4954673.1 betaine-aldehyde dehydrogenase [Paracoccaceae bacterium]MBT5316778.1 betaine-aldehyde dehydrogenase [Paracoccaceae bacterium]MBT5853717.1 betaine-aldehyde dehydrogenase [Paracoccaceae bacterium]MBT7415093.1 betaine-aldehyde dehydrogenase [Paracoccaceae bacterium]|tara:strand:- start:846 stop:2300 length:1455 start_codon:yes stop_codon:yes gene_type:complete
MSSTQPTASHFIGGRYVEDKSGSRFDVIYPASGAVIAQIHAGTDQIIEQALGAAQAAQQDWAARSGTERGRVLRRAADLIRARNRELSVLETHDTGKPLSETLYADATSGADALEYFGGLAGNVTGEHIQLGEDWVYTRREALGICLGIGAWNYPTQIACWKAAPALACGNAMIFKPSETTPLCALKIAEILSEAGLPDGVFNVVQGQGDVGAALLQDPRINKVSLTGSVATGRKVYQSAAVGLKQVTLELGGKSPLIIFEDADLENAVGGAILANFYSSGQICSNGTRVFVHKAIKEAFLDRLSARLEQAVIGDPLDETTNFGPLVSDRQMQIVQGFIAQGISEGARLVCGGRRLERPGYYLAPTVFADVSDQMTIAREEIFGPVLSVLDFDDEGDVVARANNTEYGLSAGVFTRDISRAHRVIGKLQAGSCFINSYNDAPVEAPFGGMKLSGIGRENSKNAIEHYSQLKSVYVRMGDVDAPF